MNFLNLLSEVHDKSTAILFLQKHKVFETTKTCRCGKEIKLLINEDRERFRCRDKSCRSEVSLKGISWLRGTHLEYTTIIHFLYFWTKKLTTIKFCKEELGIGSDETVVDYNNYVREVCANRLLREPVTKGGYGNIIEIDETLVSRRKYNRGTQHTHNWVFGGICRESGECFLYSIPDRTAEKLESCIRASILPGSIILSDCWPSYNGIVDMGLDYTHYTVNHSTNFVDSKTGACTNMVEGMWSRAKKKFKAMNGVHTQHVDGYLCEFMYREKLRNCDLFKELLKDIAIFDYEL